jgi:ribulose-phosphate 3-epimerase
MIKIAPSILSADFANMERDVKMLETAGADLLHCDVMDGNFVPNITFGPKMIADIRKITKLPLDVHMMLADPEKYAPVFIEAGADIVTFHMEAAKNPGEILKTISGLGKKCGVVINPATDVSAVAGVLTLCDMVLLMSVNPGFGGQAFIPDVMDKIALLRRMITASGNDVDLEIDGGVTFDNVDKIIESGANIIVAGNTVFKQSDRAAAIKRLRGV